MIQLLAEFVSSSTHKDAMEVSEPTSLRNEYFEAWKSELIGEFHEFHLSILPPATVRRIA